MIVVLQLPTREPDKRFIGLFDSRTAHVTGIVVFDMLGAIHAPVFDDDHVPVPVPQLI